ncbi:MAG: EAL domain-containing protein [Comamonas sp.]|nr:EAL domain-containing protein [Comamonas sp.]
MLTELLQGAAMLLALCFLHGANMRLWRKHPRLGNVATGLLFGGICVVGMAAPLHLAQGVIIDPRSVVLSMAALFGGPIPAAIATAMAVAMRWSVGGSGMIVGTLVILLCSSAGLLYRYARHQGRVGVGMGSLLVFGVLLHLAILLMFQALPASIRAHLNTTLLLPYVLVFSPATALLGWLLHDAEQRFATETALASNIARISAITHSIPDVIVLLDEDGRYLEVLTPDESRLVAPVAQLLGRHLSDALPPETAAPLLHAVQESLRTNTAQMLDYKIQAPSGLRHFEGRCQPLNALVQGRPAVVFIARDRTARVQAEEALRESEIRFRTLLRDIPSIAVQGYRADGTTVYWNRAAERIYGYTAEEALGQSLFDLIIPADMRPGVREAMAQMFATATPIPASELRLRHKDSSPVEVFSSHAYVHIPGSEPEIFCIDIDISGRKAAEQQAHYLAFYDALTGLPNRRLLTDRMEQIIADGARTGLYAAVLLIDVDHFKVLNDSRGHEAGDQVLAAMARRLCDCVRPQDTVSRPGGDAFIVVLGSLSTDKADAAAQVQALGGTMLQCLQAPYLLGQEEHRMSASIGAVLVTPGQASVDELLQHADLAMYQAKESGRNTLRFFDPEMQASVHQRLLLQTDMYRGLREHEFALFYQVQVNAHGQTTGAEALVRWHHPDKGLVPPNLFIPLAEETGQILELGHWVLATALHQQAQWRNDPQRAALSMSINVSARQFRQENFVDDVRQLLTASGADPHCIKLELTESLLLQDVNSVITTMQALRTLGLRLSLDDFGTGYSSLGYLKHLPLNQIKIDQGFVRNILHDTRDAAIAQSIITLAHSLGLEVIAEGVETQAHYHFLLERGCRAFQGYLFGKPQPLDDFERQLA